MKSAVTTYVTSLCVCKILLNSVQVCDVFAKCLGFLVSLSPGHVVHLLIY